jgi:hypothetical protein
MFNGIWVPESLLKYPDLPPSAKLLYGRLARFAGEDGRCFPSVETLAAELGMTVRQIQRLIGKLCTAGFLRRDLRYRPNGSQTANAYVFLYHASLAPFPVTTDRDCPKAEDGRTALGGDKNVTGVKNVTRRVTDVPPLEESQLNSDVVNTSTSSSTESIVTSAAADPSPGRYPLSTARFRHFFPRTTDSVVIRILRAILTACPDGSDEDIADSVYMERDQNSPGLWVHTLPSRVGEAIQRRIATLRASPKCQVCADAGILWNSAETAYWCPAGCEAAEEQRQQRPSFVEEWNAQFSGQLCEQNRHEDQKMTITERPPATTHPAS